jgi:hypothetical protein
MSGLQKYVSIRFCGEFHGGSFKKNNKVSSSKRKNVIVKLLRPSRVFMDYTGYKNLMCERKRND